MSKGSNSKLSKGARVALAAMMASFTDAGGKVFSFPQYGVTVAVRGAENGNAFAAVSVAAPDEQKFRRKVGQFYALDRALNGEGVTLAGAGDEDNIDYGSSTWHNRAEELASAVAHLDWSNARDLDTGETWDYAEKKEKKASLNNYILD